MFQPDQIHGDCGVWYDTLDFQQIEAITQKHSEITCWINDQAIAVFDDRFNVYTVPLWAAWAYSKWFAGWTPPDVSTKSCFNFSVNKKRINRHLLIKLVELFDFQNYDYTWSGIAKDFDMSSVIEEWNRVAIPDLDEHSKSFLLSPIQLEKKWYVNDLLSHKDVNIETSAHHVWSGGLSRMFTGSAISLISEVVQEQQIATISEKTLFAIMGLTMPIWVGGFGIPDSMKKIGFDIFDDIVDHDYQYKGTLIERCFYSIFLNRHLLSDLELAKSLRTKHQQRLYNNYQLLKSGILDRYCEQTLASFPEKVRQIFYTVDKLAHLLTWRKF